MKSFIKAKYLLPIVILVGGFFLMQFLFSFNEEAPRKKAEPRVKFVESELVQLKDIQSEIVGYGRLTSSQPIVLLSEVAGVMEKGDVSFKPGTSFKKGDLLVKIDDRQIVLDINSAKSDFLTALASLLPEIKIDFPDEFEKWQNYFDGCTFDKTLEELPIPANNKIKLFLSRFNVYKLYFAVKNLEIRLEKHYFYAPFNGSIQTADLRIGSTARAGTRLGEIINLDEMELEIPIPSQDLKWIDKSKTVKITSKEIDGEWKASITRIGETIDTQTQSLRAFLKVEKKSADKLYNGIFLEARIPGKIIKDAIDIPRRAIYETNYVYVVDEGKFDYRKVEIARLENNHAIISSGLLNNDTLVIAALQGVAPGMPAKAVLSGQGE